MHRSTTTNVASHCYFDVQATDGHHPLTPGASGKKKTEFLQARELAAPGKGLASQSSFPVQCGA
ncbi:MAG: hypothetical protein HZA90_02590 [Verrucomicrobia bacterium]|nr:hypothetical protein [Verrucomicrobiota bacterium]